MKETLSQKFLSLNNRRASIIIISLLGAWIVCFPYEGQLLYTLAKSYGMEGGELLDISLVMQVVGLVIGGIFIRTMRAAKNTILYVIPVCILCTVTFFFPSYTVWLISLTICAAMAGICITAFGYFLKNSVVPDNRFRTSAEIIININILKMLINNISLYVSIQTGFAFTMLLLGAAWYLTLKTQYIQDKKPSIPIYDKKAGIKALILLFLFIGIISINFGVMTQTINPVFNSLGWVTNFYWLLPYTGAALIMRRLKNTNERTNVLYVAVGMIGLGFILFLTLGQSLTSFLIINTVMMGAWAVSDIFWWSILFEMLEMIKRSAIILSVGFSAVMIGVLLGKVISENDLTVTGASLSAVTMAVICITLFILPILHRLLSMMIKKNAAATIDFPNIVETLTEREKQIAALLLKGRTYKLIAAELYLSENTVKTHIKNIYSKLGITRKSELFTFVIE